MTATPLPMQTVYTLSAVASLLGLSALFKSATTDQTIIRLFLLATLDTVRLENASGGYVDVGVGDIELEGTNT